MSHLPICQVCRKPFKASGWLKVHYQKEHPGFLDMDDNRDGNASPNLYEYHIAGRPPFYNRDDSVLPNFLEDGDPVIARLDGDMRFFPTEAFRYASSGDAVPIAEITNTYPYAGLPIHYVPDPTEMIYVRQQNDLISNWDDPGYAYYPFKDERSFEFVNWCLSNNVTQTTVDQLLTGQHSPLRESVQQSIKSVHCLKMLIKKMEDGLSMNLWREAEIDMTQNANHRDPIKFWYCDPIETAKWLLRQTYNSQNLVFSPERSFTNGI